MTTKEILLHFVYICDIYIPVSVVGFYLCESQLRFVVVSRFVRLDFEFVCVCLCGQKKRGAGEERRTGG